MGLRADATRGALLPLTLRLAAPVIVSEFLYASYAFVDLHFVGRLGQPSALAAVAALFPILVLNAALFRMVHIGTLALVAQHTGAGRAERVSAAFVAGCWVAGALSLTVAAIGACAAEPLVAIVCPRLPDGRLDPEALAAGATYLRIVFLGAPLTHFAQVVDATYKGRGDTLTPLALEGLGLAANVFLTAGMTLGQFGFPRLGVAGAALSTLGSRGLVLALGGSLLLAGRLGFRIAPAECRPNWTLIRQNLRIGAPQGASSLAYMAAMTIVFHLAARLGAAASSGVGIGIRQIEFVAFTHYVGLHAAAATIVGQNVGAGNLPRAWRGAWTALGVATGLGTLALAAFTGFAGPLAQWVAGAAGDPAIVAHTADYVRVIGVSQVLLAIDIAGVGIFVGGGRTGLVSTMSTLSLALRVAIVVALTAAGWGFAAVTWGMTLSTMLKGAGTLGAVALGLWLPRVSRARGAPSAEAKALAPGDTGS